MNIVKLWIEKLEQWVENKGRQYVIMDDYNSKDPKPYLIRSIVFKSKWFCIYIHRFLSSDKPVPHDHPWNFFTWIISKGYVEQLYFDIGVRDDQQTCWSIARRPGSIIRRKCSDVHRVVVSKEYSLEEKNEAPLSVCFIGPRKQEWSFYDNGKKIDWREFLEVKPGDPMWEAHE